MAEVGEKKGVFGIPLLIGAVGFGLAAALLSYIYLKSEEKALIEKYAGREGRPVTVLVAGADLRKGEVLRQEVLSQRKIPLQFAHNDAIPAAEYEKYLGRVVEVDIAAGKPILKSFLDDVFPVDFSDTVPVGRRAMTIQVDDRNAIASFLRPGNHVDLFVNIPSAFSGFAAGFVTPDLIDQLPGALRDAIPPALLEVARTADTGNQEVQSLLAGALPKDVILPVLQNVRVLATGRDPYREQLDSLRYPQPRSERNFSTITLDVTPRDAALLTAALDKGEILALLRNRGDEGQADFATVSAVDLFSNAFGMAESAAEQRSRVSAAAGVDARGNLVDADGKTLMSSDQLAAAGLTVNADGQLVDADGNVVDPADLVVTADGKVVSKKALAAAGLSVNEAGQVVDANGNVVDANDIVVTKDGRVMTKQELAAAGLSVNADGEVVDSTGKVVDTAKIVKTADGKILTAEALAAAGLSVNENGEVVDANGNVVDPSKLIVSGDGKVLNAEQLAAAGLTVNEKGEVVDANGNVVDPATLMTDANGKVLDAKALAAAGLSVNENGQIVDKDGNVVDPAELVMTENGLLSKAQLDAAGLKVDASGKVIDASGRVLSAKDVANVAANTPITGGSKRVDLIIGGQSKDGIAKQTTLKATE
ncbi:MAG: Flp pilus assembly protein CpaB [Gammaproteobacteria bacterium]